MNFDNETDADLLTFMAMAEADPAGARQAWDKFYRRHVEYLFGRAMRSFRETLREDGVADLVAQTFRRAYEKAGQFECGDEDDRQVIERRVRAWLGAIARNLFISGLRHREPTVQLPDDSWQEVEDISCSEQPVSEDIALVEEALQEALNEKEREVIHLTYQYYDPERENQRLPSGVAADLAKHLGTTEENVRQLRRRALKKIADYVVKAWTRATERR